MSELSDAERCRLTSRAVESEQIIKDLRAELEELTTIFLEKRRQDMAVRIAEENETLLRQIKERKSHLINLEIEHKVPQIARPPFPREPGEVITHHQTVGPPPLVKEYLAKSAEASISKPSKASKVEKSKPAAGPDSNGPKVEAAIDVSRLDLKIGRIIVAKKHPDADALYVEEVDVGEDKPRCVVSGLVKHVPLEEMQNRMVVLLCNLKPAKMRGVTSQAMVMCASTPEKVEILVPPTGAQPGDLVHVEGFPRNPDPILNPKHKVFETVAPDLRTDSNRAATYKGIVWTVPGKGPICAPSLIGAPIK